MTYYGLFSCDLVFSTFKEYKFKRRKIFDYYRRANVQQKVIYRMYVYTRPLLKEKQKDFIWNEIVASDMEN